MRPSAVIARVVYAYERELDHYGHVHGCSSADLARSSWRESMPCASGCVTALPPQVA